mmetsp:Transcript_72397/g.143538  ORF Transcript_72397/g.143538 Transcript_72397/m.143538 type:complete len:206 (+) Transcript_72397:225-842(+)
METGSVVIAKIQTMRRFGSATNARRQEKRPRHTRNFHKQLLAGAHPRQALTMTGNVLIAATLTLRSARPATGARRHERRSISHPWLFHGRSLLQLNAGTKLKTEARHESQNHKKFLALGVRQNRKPFPVGAQAEMVSPVVLDQRAGAFRPEALVQPWVLRFLGQNRNHQVASKEENRWRVSTATGLVPIVALSTGQCASSAITVP